MSEKPENTCPKCGTPYQPYQLVCPKCGTLLFDPTSSTLHMRIDPSLLRLRHSHLASATTLTPEQAISFQIRGLVERVIFEEGTEIILGRVDVGQSASSRLDLTRYGAHERGVSREHALMRYKDGKLTMTDLGSVNGTMLNGQKLNPDQPQEVHDGDELLLGHLSIQVHFEEAPRPKPPAVEEDNQDMTRPIKVSELSVEDKAPRPTSLAASGDLAKTPELPADDKISRPTSPATADDSTKTPGSPAVEKSDKDAKTVAAGPDDKASSDTPRLTGQD